MKSNILLILIDQKIRISHSINDRMASLEYNSCEIPFVKIKPQKNENQPFTEFKYHKNQQYGNYIFIALNNAHHRHTIICYSITLIYCYSFCCLKCWYLYHTSRDILLQYLSPFLMETCPKILFLYSSLQDEILAALISP